LLEMWMSFNFFNVIWGRYPHCLVVLWIKHPVFITRESEMKIGVLVCWCFASASRMRYANPARATF
jgi:hypothetical protein